MQRLEAAERRVEILLKDEAGGADLAVPFAPSAKAAQSEEE
jgi:hypothetical protein